MIYHGRALASLSVSRAVSIVAGGLAFVLFVYLTLFAASLGLGGF